MHETTTFTSRPMPPPFVGAEPEAPSLGALAYKVYTAHRLDFEAAVDALERELRNDAALLRTLLRGIARDAIRGAAGRYRREFTSLRPDEDVTVSAPAPSPTRPPKHVNGLPTTEHLETLQRRTLAPLGRSWMNRPLAFYSGVMLSQATRPMLLEAANLYRRNAETATKEAKRYAAIAKRLPNDTTTVAEALNETQLSLIMGGAR